MAEISGISKFSLSLTLFPVNEHNAVRRIPTLHLKIRAHALETLAAMKVAVEFATIPLTLIALDNSFLAQKTPITPASLFIITSRTSPLAPQPVEAL